MIKRTISYSLLLIMTVSASAQTQRAHMDALLTLIRSADEKKIQEFLDVHTQLQNTQIMKVAIANMQKEFAPHEVMNEDIREGKIAYIIESAKSGKAKEIILLFDSNTGKIATMEFKDFIPPGKR